MESVLISILFLLILITALLVVLIARKAKRTIIHEEKHWYYVIFVCEKFTWCKPEVQAEFWHCTADELAKLLEGSNVESITKLD